MTSKLEISQWLATAKAEGATHMVVVVDEFDHDDFPVNVMPGEDSRVVAATYDAMEMHRVMEVYNLISMDIQEQLGQRRAMNH